MNKYSKLMALSFILIFTNGCTKKYTSPEKFYDLPVAEQIELCQKWIEKSGGRTTYHTIESYNGSSASTSQAMGVDAANAGAALAALNRKNAKHNFKYCTPRHLSTGLPEGYSTYFASGINGVNGSNKVELILLEVDQLNVEATKLALAGNYNKAIDLTKQAIKIQKNPYSSDIQGASYILAAMSEKNTGNKIRLYKKSIESFSMSSSFKRGSSYDESGNEAHGSASFLQGYAYYMINQNENAYYKMSLDTHSSSIFEVSERYLFKAVLLCADLALSKKLDGYCHDDDRKQYGEYCTGSVAIRTAKMWYDDLSIKYASQSWLKESIGNVAKTCTGDSTLRKHFNENRLELPSEAVLRYLDQIDFRNFSEAP